MKSGKLIPHSRPNLTGKEQSAGNRVMRKKDLSAGACVAEFESDLVRLVGCRYAAAVSSGSAAITLLLKAMDLPPTGQVIIPDYVCTSVYYAVLAAGSQPILCDVDENGIIDEKKMQELITPDTKAIVAVNLFGRLYRFKNRYRIPVIDDACPSLGGYDRSGKSGNRGDFGIGSFYATKVITAAGSGGAVFGNDAGINKKIIAMRDNDLDHHPDDLPHINARLGNLSAAIGSCQLRRLPEMIKRRRRIYEYYCAELFGSGLELPRFATHETVFRFVVKPADRDRFIRRMRKHGVECKLPVSLPLHRVTKLPHRRFPVSAELVRTSVSIPLYPDLSDSEVATIVTAIKKNL